MQEVTEYALPPLKPNWSALFNSTYLIEIDPYHGKKYTMMRTPLGWVSGMRIQQWKDIILADWYRISFLTPGAESPFIIRKRTGEMKLTLRGEIYTFYE